MTSDTITAIHRELQDIRATGWQHITHIRVTTTALPGSLVTVSITPERARALGRLFALPSGGVIADPETYEPMRELLVHPADYATLLADCSETARYSIAHGEPTRIFGILVSVDP